MIKYNKKSVFFQKGDCMKANDILNLNLDKDFDLTSVNFDSYQGLLGNTLISIGSDAMLSFNYMSVIKRCVENSLHYFDRNLDIQSKEPNDYIKLTAIDMISGDFRMDSYIGNKSINIANLPNTVNVFSRSLLINPMNYDQVVSEASPDIQFKNDVDMVLADIRFSTLNFMSMLLETMKTIKPTDEDYVFMVNFLVLICKDTSKLNNIEKDTYKNTLDVLFETSFSDSMGYAFFKRNWLGELMYLAKAKKEVDGQVSTLEMLDLIDVNSLMKFCYLLRLSLLNKRTVDSSKILNYVKNLTDGSNANVLKSSTFRMSSPFSDSVFELSKEERDLFSNIWKEFESFLKDFINTTYDSIKQDVTLAFEKNLDIKPTLLLGFLEISKNNPINGDKDIPFFRNKTYICMFYPTYNRVWNSVSLSIFGQISDLPKGVNIKKNEEVAKVSIAMNQDVEQLLIKIQSTNNIQDAIDQQLLAFQKMQMAFDSICELPGIGDYYRNKNPEILFQDMISLITSENIVFKGVVLASGIEADFQKAKSLFTSDASKTFSLLSDQYNIISSNVQAIQNILSKSKDIKQIKDLPTLKKSLLSQYVLQNKIYFILQKISFLSLILDNKSLSVPKYRGGLGVLPPQILAVIASSTVLSAIYAMKWVIFSLIVFLSILPIIYKYCMTVIAGGGNLASGIAMQEKHKYALEYQELSKLPDTDPTKQDRLKVAKELMDSSGKLANYGLRKEIDKVAITDVPGLLGSSLVKVAVAGLAVGIGIKLFFMYKKEKLSLEAQKAIQ